MDKYKFCANGVTSQIYQEFTVASFSCDAAEGTSMVHLEELYDEKDLTINWNFFDSGLLCRVIISAKESINGKLMLQIREISGERISFFMQPNNLP